MSLLQHRFGSIDVDDSILFCSSGRCHWKAFGVNSGEPLLKVRRVDFLSENLRQPMQGSPAPWGYVQLEGDELRAYIPEDVWAAESVLRIAYHVATVRRGGLLVHASGVAWESQAVVALGQSGAGKSTLAELCSLPQNEGTLLSDEIVQLYPDGTCAGTPFRSNLENVGAPGVYRVASLLSLQHAQEERLRPLLPQEALLKFLPQVYASNVVPISQVEAFARLSQVINQSAIFQLSFRKNPAVGLFLRDWVRGKA